MKPTAPKKAIASIFVIDDARWHNVIVKKILAASGYKVRTFTKGHSLLQSLKEEIPRMIISDINMPSLDGFELYDKIRKLPMCKNIPFLYVTSLKRDKIDGKIKARRPAGMIQKPIEKEPFLNEVIQKL